MERKFNNEGMNYEVIRGDVFYIDLPKIEGTSIQAGVRVCIAVSNDMNNTHSSTITVVSGTTSTTKHRLPTHVNVLGGSNGCKYDTTFLCEQVLTVSKKMITGRAGRVDEITMKRIEKAIGIQLGTIKKEYVNLQEVLENIKQLKNDIEGLEEDMVRYNKPRHFNMLILAIKELSVYCIDKGVDPNAHMEERYYKFLEMSKARNKRLV